MSHFKDSIFPSKHQLNFENETRVKRFRPNVGEYDPDTRSMPKRPGLPDVTKPPPSSETLQTFKAFLQTQPDTITETEAHLMYKAYKEKFTKRKVKEFFDSHCEEEWFKEKYYPNISENLMLSSELNRKKRLDLFWDLSATVENLRLDYSNQKEVIKFMEKVAHKLEDSQRDAAGISRLSSSSRNAGPLGIEEQVQVNCQSLYRVVANNNNCTDQEMVDAKYLCNLKMDSTKNVDFIVNELIERVFSQRSKRDVCGFFGDPEDMSESMDTEDQNSSDNTSAVSIHLKRVPVSLTKSELISLLSKYPGFVRLALSEPTQDTDFKTRKAWASYTKETNVKDLCIELEELDFGGRGIGAVVNKVLSKKVRLNTIVFLTHDKVVRNDIRLASKIIRKKDQDWNLTEEGGDRLLVDLADHLVEVANAEEDELLGINQDAETKEVFDLEINDDLIQYLDKLILYLRIVHSFDYYNCIEYHREDDMPNRFGLLHIRGRKSKERLRRTMIEDHMKSQEVKMRPFMEKVTSLSDLEVTALGIRDEDQEVERFIKANIEELKPGRFLCPLSGKKFKGEEYVRKHIESKFVGRLEEVRNVVKSFNNYLRDRNRPQSRLERTLPLYRPMTINTSNNNFRNPPPGPSHYGRYKDPRSNLNRGQGSIGDRYNDARPRVDYNDIDMFRQY